MRKTGSRTCCGASTAGRCVRPCLCLCSLPGQGPSGGRVRLQGACACACAACLHRGTGGGLNLPWYTLQDTPHASCSSHLTRCPAQATSLLKGHGWHGLGHTSTCACQSHTSACACHTSAPARATPLRAPATPLRLPEPHLSARATPLRLPEPHLRVRLPEPAVGLTCPLPPPGRGRHGPASACVRG